MTSPFSGDGFCDEGHHHRRTATIYHYVKRKVDFSTNTAGPINRSIADVGQNYVIDLFGIEQ